MTSDQGHLLALGISRIHRSDSLEALMQAFLSVVPTLVDADAYGLYLLDGRLQARAIYALRADRRFLTEYEQLRMADPCFLHLLRHRRFVHTEAALARQDWLAHPLRQLMSRWGLHYSIEAPLMVDGELAGTLNIARRDRGYFERSGLECARLLCDDMAYAFERLARTQRLAPDLANIDKNTGVAAQRRPEPAYIRVAEDYIRAHCAEPLTIERLAAASGVSQRTLLEGFRRHRGTSPKAMLRDLRFQRVREALLGAAPGSATVADIATAWGFYELGHFAVEYRRRYAEPPSATLRCAATATADAGARAVPEIYELFDGAVRQARTATPAFRRSPALDS